MKRLVLSLTCFLLVSSPFPSIVFAEDYPDPKPDPIPNTVKIINQ